VILTGGQSGLSLDKVARCHEGICRAASAIFGSVLYEGSRGMMPIAQFNHFDNLDDPWLSPGDVMTLSGTWNAHVEKVEAWAARY
jgi:hypothetical protein